MAKCLRCGAGAEWIQGKVPDEVPVDEPADQPSECLVRLPRCAQYPKCPCGGPEGWTDNGSADKSSPDLVPAPDGSRVLVVNDEADKRSE